MHARTRSDRTGADPPNLSACTPLLLNETGKNYIISVPDPSARTPRPLSQIDEDYIIPVPDSEVFFSKFLDYQRCF